MMAQEAKVLFGYFEVVITPFMKEVQESGNTLSRTTIYNSFGLKGMWFICGFLFLFFSFVQGAVVSLLSICTAGVGGSYSSLSVITNFSRRHAN